MLIELELPAVSVEYIRTTVTTDTDLSGLPVEGALLPVEPGEPASIAWTAAEWDGDAIRWLYPGGYTTGVYEFWVRITAAGETPVRRTGLVLLY